MPRFIIERNVGKINMDQLKGVGMKSNEVLQSQDMEGVKWIKSYVSEVDGKIYCEYEAPNAEIIREHARRVGIPADKVALVSAEVNPSMFR